MLTAELFFPPDHPAAQGHFPGNPIIPGAVLLSEALRAMQASVDLSLSPAQIAAAKFLHPVRPGDRVRIEFSDAASGAIKFAGSVGETRVLTGVVTCGALSIPA